jgi:hypothetical protein
MSKYIQIRAIERLKEQLEYGGGIASGEPPIISAQADYLIALSGGLPLDEIRVRRILPLAVFISDETETASFQTLAEIIINDLLPSLDAEFISAPLAEVGSIGWRPTIRTKKRYTAKELANREETIERACDRAVRMLVADRPDYEHERRQMEEARALFAQGKRQMEEARALLEGGKQRLERAEHSLWTARVHGTYDEIQYAKHEHENATSYFELRKADLELRKAEYEMSKAKYEKDTALIEAFTKLAQALLKIAASCVVILGSLHIFSHKPSADYPINKIHVERKSASEAYDSWSGEISEVLRKLAEELDSK